jgi:DNA-binding NarL/FixJ family response regulator
MLETPPDLVLVDLRLPDGHGLELLAEGIPASDTEFVVVTGKRERRDRGSARSARARSTTHQAVRSARLTGVLANVARTRGLKSELNGLRWQLRRLGRFGSSSARRRRCRRSTT